MSVLLQPCGEAGELFNFLSGHAMLSAATGDSAAAVEDIETMFRIAAQLRDLPFLVAELSSLSRFASGLHTWSFILERHPDALSAEQLLRLETAAKSFAHGQQLVSFTHEKMNFADSMQRTFPEDGVVIRGAPKLSNPASLFNLVVPIGRQVVLTRKENVAAFERLIELGDQELKKPFWEASTAEYDREAARIKGDETLVFASLMISSLSNSQLRQETFIQQRHALLTASALNRFRLATGSYPRTLAELVPSYLPTIPPDRYTGEPLSYKLDAGRPLLYSIGNDGVDDGGRPAMVTDSSFIPGQAHAWYSTLLPKDDMVDGDLIVFPVAPRLKPIVRVEE